MFTSPTYGKLNIQDIPEKIRIFFEKHEQYGAPVQIIVGTDSQNFDQTKVVSVIAVICEGLLLRGDKKTDHQRCAH